MFSGYGRWRICILRVHKSWNVIVIARSCGVFYRNVPWSLLLLTSCGGNGCVHADIYFLYSILSCLSGQH